MNTEYIEENHDKLKYGRKEYVRLARESCLKNYYGDQMKSRDSILKEAAEKKRREEEQRKQQESMAENTSMVIPFDVGKQMHSERMNADIINQRLAKTRMNLMTPIQRDEVIPQQETFIEDRDELMIPETPEENIPESSDILRMSGIEESPQDRIPNDYLTDYTQMYHTDSENANFVTSIRNADPVESEEVHGKKHQTAKETKAFRLLVVRCVCALLLLAGFIAMDKFSVTYQGINADTIYERIVSTELLEQVETWLTAQTGNSR